MNQYILIGTYPNRNKKAFVVMAENYSKAIQKMLLEESDSFINIEVVDTYGSLTAIGGAAIMGNDKSIYHNVAQAMEVIKTALDEYEITQALDEYGEATDLFHARFDNYLSRLNDDSQTALFSLLGTAKELISITEKAGHDCL